jgi:hypothetical protein
VHVSVELELRLYKLHSPVVDGAALVSASDAFLAATGVLAGLRSKGDGLWTMSVYAWCMFP